MEIHNRRELQRFVADHPEAKKQIDAWVEDMEKIRLTSPHELKRRYQQASIIGGGRVVFDICHNRYRLLVVISYNSGIVMVEKAGTHKEYDRWEI